ncbi:metallophosphoesterase [Candidatus Bathyarchaeota archaeon]|nr:metallophosphoesterase [Candidatus Bathyarchaeota archaeon]
MIRVNTKTVLFLLTVILLLSLAGPTSNQPSGVKADPEMSSEDQSWSYAPYSAENFTIIVLPDTQYYSESYPEIFDNQTQWIIENKEVMNIVFVTHLGDLVDHSYSETEWENANNSISKLDGQVPYGVLPGNHDVGGLSVFNTYFGIDRFNSESWYGGAYQGDNTNNYQLFSAGGDQYLIIHLQYNPSEDILAWAGAVVDSHPNRRVIVSTHEYLAGSWLFWRSSRRSSIGNRVWNNFVKQHADQIFLVLCGHEWEEISRTDEVNGFVVHQVLSDYQSREKGGNGWLRILEFSPSQDKIFVRTFSPYLNGFEFDSNSEFTLGYDMTAYNTNVTILSNSTLSMFAFSQPKKQMSFTVTGETGSTGYCDLTIPIALLDGAPWTVEVDGVPQDYALNENATHSFIYFTYTHSSPLSISITGTSVIPEFGSIQVLPLLLAAFLLTAILIKKIKTHNKNYNAK